MHYIRKDTSRHHPVEVDTLLQDAIRDIFIGRMLLFGFKVLPNHERQMFQEESCCNSQSTLEFVLKNTASSKTSNSDFLQSTFSLQTHSGGAHFLENKTLIAFQTIDPNSNQVCGTVVNIFQEKVTTIVDRAEKNNGFSTENCATLSQGCDAPMENFLPGGNSSYCDLSDNSNPSFCQPSLMLSCDIETSDKEVSPLVPIESVSDNNTLSPAEIARSRSILNSNGHLDGDLQSIDFDETMDPDSMPSVNKGDSLIPTQSQHLSQPNTWNSQFECSTQGNEFAEVTDCEPELNARSLTRSFSCEKTHQVSNENSGQLPAASTDGHPPDILHNTAIDEDSINDSELLLACGYQQTQENAETVADGHRLSYANINGDRSIDKNQEIHLRVQDISDSFDEDDCKLVIAADIFNGNAEDPVEVVPDSETQPVSETELPYSEGLDSFLRTQLVVSELNSNPVKECLVSNTTQNNAVSNLAPTTALPNCEDLFPDSALINKENSTCSVMEHDSEKERTYFTSVTALPDSENLENFLENSQLAHSRTVAGRKENGTELDALHLPHSEGLESFLDDQSNTYSKNSCAKQVSPPQKKEQKQCSSTGNKNAKDTVARVVNGRRHEAENDLKIDNTCDSEKDSVVDDESERTDGSEMTVNDSSCNRGAQDLQPVLCNSLEQFSNDLFASDCELSTNFNLGGNGAEDSGVIPATQFDNGCNLNIKPTKEHSICEANRRKSVHFAPKMFQYEQISGIDKQMRTTPLTNSRITKHKSCLRNVNLVPDLPFSPVICDTNKKSLDVQFESMMITPSPEIVTCMLRQVDNISYQSTPLSLPSSHSNDFKRNRTECSKRQSLKVKQVTDIDLAKENDMQTEYSRELFSEDSCELFSTSHVTQQDDINDSICSRNFIPKSTGICKRHASKIFRQTHRKAMETTPDTQSDMELFSANSEELFSNGSLTDLTETSENLCKKLF